MSGESSPLQSATSDRRGMRGERRKRKIPVTMDRRKSDRRGSKHEKDEPIGVTEPPDRPDRKGERRRQVDPTTCERDYNDDEIAFMKAMDQYKRDNRRPFPTWSEVLEVLTALGYRRVAEATRLPGLSGSNTPKKG